MTCEGYQEQVSQFIDNELEERDAPALFSHLSTCEECRGFLRTTMRLRAGLQEQAPLLAPNHLDEKVMGARPASKRFAPDRVAIPGVTPTIVWKRRISLPVPVAAVVIVLLMLGSIALSSLWFRGSEPGYQTQTIYVTTLPAVEVQALYPQQQTTLQ
jgi:predicted anti-sigma-YlaC factor YlaD